MGAKINGSGKLFNRHIQLAPGSGIASNGLKGIATFMPLATAQSLTDAGAANITSFLTKLTTTGAAAVTLADGQVIGQLKKIQLIVDAGDATLTPAHLAGGTTITFADAGDFALLLWDGQDWNAVELGNDADGATAPVLA